MDPRSEPAATLADGDLADDFPAWILGARCFDARAQERYGVEVYAQPILDDHAATGRVAYSVSNPVSANLVDDADEWPSLNLASGPHEAQAEEHRARRAIAESHARASERLLTGDRTAVFPKGTYPPPVLAVA